MFNSSLAFVNAVSASFLLSPITFSKSDLVVSILVDNSFFVSVNVLFVVSIFFCKSVFASLTSLFILSVKSVLAWFKFWFVVSIFPCKSFLTVVNAVLAASLLSLTVCVSFLISSVFWLIFPLFCLISSLFCLISFSFCETRPSKASLVLPISSCAFFIFPSKSLFAAPISVVILLSKADFACDNAFSAAFLFVSIVWLAVAISCLFCLISFWFCSIAFVFLPIWSLFAAILPVFVVTCFPKFVFACCISDLTALISLVILLSKADLVVAIFPDNSFFALEMSLESACFAWSNVPPCFVISSIAFVFLPICSVFLPIWVLLAWISPAFFAMAFLFVSTTPPVLVNFWTAFWIAVSNVPPCFVISATDVWSCLIAPLLAFCLSWSRCIPCPVAVNIVLTWSIVWSSFPPSFVMSLIASLFACTDASKVLSDWL